MKTLGSEVVNAFIDVKGKKVLPSDDPSDNMMANFYGGQLTVVSGEKDSHVTLLLPATSMQGDTEIRLTPEDINEQVRISLEEFEGDDLLALEMYKEYNEVPEIDNLISRLVVRSAIDTGLVKVPEYETIEEIIAHEENHRKSLA